MAGAIRKRRPQGGPWERGKHGLAIKKPAPDAVFVQSRLYNIITRLHRKPGPARHGVMQGGCLYDMEYGPDVNKCLSHRQSFHPITGIFNSSYCDCKPKRIISALRRESGSSTSAAQTWRRSSILLLLFAACSSR